MGLARGKGRGVNQIHWVGIGGELLYYLKSSEYS